jgi:aryl-alcohol dehydrogenase-like predicted oxidoreductase
LKQVRLPGTDLEVSRLGFGTASLHHLMRAKERSALLASALDSGLTHFDSARMYGEGLAQRSLGDFLAGGLRSRVTLATKIGFSTDRLSELVPVVMYLKKATGSIARRLGISSPGHRTRELTPADAERTLARSLQALRTDWIDVLFVHEPQPEEIPALHELARWLQVQKSSGRARWLGLSGTAEQCVAVVKEIGGVFDVLQLEDSVERREGDAVRAIGWPLQITYGYFRLAGAHAGEATLSAALERNAQGMVLMSSRRPERIRSAAQQAQREAGA